MAEEYERRRVSSPSTGKKRKSRKRKRRQRRILIAVIVLILVAAAAVAGILIWKNRQPAVWDGGYPVHISEVMAGNVGCPNEEGVLCDWIELENTSDSDFDLAGYALSDSEGGVSYTFPAGTKVPANGYLVVWCDAERGGSYAPFSLKKSGGETICFMNSNTTVIDKADTVETVSGQSMIRGEDGTFSATDTPTPGYPNTPEGAAAWAEELASRTNGVLELSEIMTSNSRYVNNGVLSDWIEVRNTSTGSVDLAGYRLSDREDDFLYEFPDRLLAPGEYLVISCFGDAAGEYEAPFALSKDGGETVYLLASNGTLSDSVTLPAMEKDTSYIKAADGTWTVTDQPTPGYSNDDAGRAALEAAMGSSVSDVVISEMMAKNKAVLADSDGEFSDWIELANTGSDTVSLTGWYLSDSATDLYRWQLPETELAPGEYLVIFASGKDRTEGELHTNFSLSDSETVYLTMAGGTIADTMELDNLEDCCSCMRLSDGSCMVSAWPTPGYENSAEGYDEFQNGRVSTGSVQINEAVSAPASGSDWVEFKNTSSSSVDLTGWYFTDKLNEAVPQTLSGTIEAGALAVFDCTEFGLNATSDEIYLYDNNGNLVDYVHLHDIPSGGSMGRMAGQGGFYLFAAPTRGSENEGGWRMQANRPVSDTASGVYTDVDSLQVTLSGEGSIYYTLDGSTPTEESTLYSGPLTVTGNTVLRAISVLPGASDSKPATFSYFLDVDTELPVISLVTDESNLFGPTGIYGDSNETAWSEGWEREGNLSFFEDGDSFSIECGMSIHGRTSRRTSEKRSLTVKFKNKYDGKLHYDVFGDGRVDTFSSLILRASVEDNYTSYMRDELFASLAMEETSVPAQDYRYAVLYINGEYWGLYSIREHHNADYFASHYDVDADTVDYQTGEFRGTTAWNDLLTYCENNGYNLSSDEGYNYIASQVDIDEMIEWLILECWSGDIDVYENVRFYSSPDYNDGKYMYGLVDMDLTMMNHQTYSVGFDYGPSQVHYIIPASLKNNPTFRDKFLTRLGEMLQGPMSDENMLARIDAISSIFSSETAADLERWDKDPSTFESQLANLKNFTTGRAAEMVTDARSYFNMTDAEMSTYFGSLA